MAEIDSIPTLPKKPKPFNFGRIRRDFLCGSIAGIIIVFSGHPCDTIKVRMQILGDSFFKTVVSIVKEEGVLALYKGVRSPLYSSPMLTAVSFASYELGNRLQGIKPGDKVTLTTALISGSLAGLFFGPTVAPVDLVKCRQQLGGVGDHTKGPKIKDITKAIVREHGITGLFKGFWITLIRDIPGLAANFGLYEESKRLLNLNFGKSHFWSFVAGGIATVGSWTLIYPFDTIKTRIQCSYTPLSITECSRQLYREGGLKQFFKGLSPCLIRAVFTGTTRYLAYEKCQKWLGGGKYYEK